MKMADNVTDGMLILNI